MDWEYYIDNDFSNSIIRAGVFIISFKYWYKNIVISIKEEQITCDKTLSQLFGK